MTTPLSPAAPTGPADDFQLTPRRDTPWSIRAEITIVFLITLGMSALSSIVDIIETQIKASQAKISLAQVTVAVAAPRSTLTLIDLFRQLLSILQLVAWGFLGLYLLWRAGVNLGDRLGLDLRHPWRDLASGVGLAALIGIPGLALYLVANSMGLSLTVQGSTLHDTWWRLPVAIMLAIGNGFLEEMLVIGYLLTRLEHLKVKAWWAIAIAAVLRGGYHLYQGYGGFLGNALMGVVFGWVFLRWRRIWPLIIAHSLIDIIVFIGYPLVKGHISWIP